jgi:hypothetical protein
VAVLVKYRTGVDYGCKDFPGAKNAIDEYLRNNPLAFFLAGPAGSAFLIK